MSKIFFSLFILNLFSCKDFGNPVNLQETTNYTYSEHIQPIFNQNCIACHGENIQYGNLKLDSYQAVINSNVIFQESSSSSILYDRITLPESNGSSMPPAGPLSAQDIELINVWINLEVPENW
jgi:mono/diheme cytochrome c family protein